MKNVNLKRWFLGMFPSPAEDEIFGETIVITGLVVIFCQFVFLFKEKWQAAIVFGLAIVVSGLLWVIFRKNKSSENEKEF